MKDPTIPSYSEPTGEMGTGCRVASRMVGVRAYQPPAADPRVDLRLDANEGPTPDGRAMRTLQSITPELLRRYPSAATLERAIAERFGIDPQRVVVTNGGDDAIDRLCRATLEPGRTLVRHTPTFAMIEHSARLAGGTPIAVPWDLGPFPAEAFIERITPATGLVALVSPNNPTGLAIDTRALLRVVDASARTRSAALVDLAYVEFADVDPTPELLDRSNAVMVRTFSKAYGLAGLRVGYAIAPTKIAALLRAAGGPYPVSGVSLALASAALEQSDERIAAIERVRQERGRLIGALRNLGFEALPSQANFVLARRSDATAVRDALLSHGISVRAFASDPALRDAVRISLPGDPMAFDRLLAALGSIAASTPRPMEPTP